MKTARPDRARRWLDDVVHDQGFLASYPQYAAVLAGLTPIADPSVPLLGLSLHGTVDGARYYLHLNLPALEASEEFARGLLLHEVHHLVLGHLAHPKFFEPDEPKMMELAMEVSANEHIREPLPDPILVEHFGRVGLRGGQSTMDRYQTLLEADGTDVRRRPGTKLVDDHDWNDRPAPPEGALEATQALLKRAASSDEATEGSRLLAGRSPRTLMLQLGLTPEGPAEVDWTDALQRFFAQRRAPVRTFARPNRRFPSRIGAVPGRSYRLRPALRPTILVALDTSLSMTPEELTQVANELEPLSQLARLKIAECDVEVQRTYPFAGLIDAVQGRGGTDLRPALDPTYLRRHDIEGVVYFTDGQGPFPRSPPPVPVLWVLTKPEAFACPWGDRARLRGR